MDDNYLAAEELILARLSAVLGTDAKALAARDLAGVKESAQITPAVHVILDGDTPKGQAVRGKHCTVEQRWLLVVVTRSARDARSGAGARDAAGPLITGVLNAMSGWSPPESRFQPFSRTATNYRPQYSPGGFFYFPLAFATEFAFTAAPV